MVREAPRKFDVTSYPKPEGVLDITWTHLEMRPRYIKEYPFEKELVAVPCSGSSVRGNKKNHAFYMELIEPVWTEAGENDFEYGLWEFQSQRLSGWIPKGNLPKTYEVEGKVFKVKIGVSHDLCPQCH